MSRHRNVRAIDVDEEYDGYYSCYGHSVEDDFCISPQTEAQFLYNRSQNQSMDAYFDLKETVPEEDETYEDNTSYEFGDSAVDNAKLQSCIEAMQDVVGESVPEAVLQKAALDHKFDLEKALNAVLLDKAPKPQRKVVELPSNTDKAPKPQRRVVELPSNTEVIKRKPIANGSSEIGSEKTKLETNIESEKPEKNESNESSKIENTETVTEAKADTVTEAKADTITEAKTEIEVDKTPSRMSDSLSYGRLKVIREKQKNSPKSPKRHKSELPQKSSQNVDEIYQKERGSEKARLNLVVVGHVDAGKSTLMGNVLYRLGQVSKKAMHKFEQESKKLGKSSFMYAWVLDETPEERNRGITMDVAQTRFETPSKSIVLLDAPGHKDFIPNMITGAAQADAAVLVVDSTKGEFETGFEAGGQTREHTMLIRSLGVSQLVIAVNKMDNNNWSQERFHEIKSKLTAFLKTVGYKEGDATFVPCSGLSGENLTSSAESPELKSWYSGPTIIDVIDGFDPPERPINKPLRICINDVFKGITGGFCLAGRVESGCITTGDKVLVMPAGEQGSVKSITIDDQPVQHSFAGESIVIQVNGIDITNVTTGSMVCDVDRPVKVISQFEARLVIFNIAIPITRGFPVVLHYQSMCEQAVIKKILSQLNRSTGEVIRNKPRCLTKNSSAIVVIEVSKPVCIELFREFKGLGRFMLRHAGSTIAAGLVTSLK